MRWLGADPHMNPFPFLAKTLLRLGHTPQLLIMWNNWAEDLVIVMMVAGRAEQLLCLPECSAAGDRTHSWAVPADCTHEYYRSQ